MVFRCKDGQMVRLSPGQETALQTGNIPAAALCKELLSDRDRLLEEIAKRDAKINEYERGLCLAADMIMCLSSIRGCRNEPSLPMLLS